MNRINGDRFIFCGTDLKSVPAENKSVPINAREFVEVLGHVALNYGVEFHAYCVMGNHYHLLVRAPEDELRRALDFLEAGIAGRLGQARLLHLELGRHLLQVTRYIHCNPVEAGLVSRPEDWKWSSYHGYLDRLDGEYWLRTSSVLGWLGCFAPRLQYRMYVMGTDLFIGDRL